MKLAPGFVVGGKYTIERLISTGRRTRLYSAVSDVSGPGRVAIKVAKHERLQTLDELIAGRAAVTSEWEQLVSAHWRGFDAAPLPIELVSMYPGDRDVRAVAVRDVKLVGQEPYLVMEQVAGENLGQFLRSNELDDDRLLSVVLRLLLVARNAAIAGVPIQNFSLSNFIVDPTGENICVADLGSRDSENTGTGASAESQDSSDRAAANRDVPPELGRLFVTVIAGIAAPNWDFSAENQDRWAKLLSNRRIPPEFHRMLLGCVGYREEFDATYANVETRLRAILGYPVQTEYPKKQRSFDADFLIAAGERIGNRFRIIEPLAQGGRGFVYRAVDELSNIEVLVKANKYSYSSGSEFSLELPTRRLELEHEFEILRQFSTLTGLLPQPIALVRDRGRGAWFDFAPVLALDEPYLVMEHLRGVSLTRLMENPAGAYSDAPKLTGQIKAKFVLRVVSQVAAFLEVLHDAGFLYQDLKSDNILFDADTDSVFLVDVAGVCPRTPDGVLIRTSVAFGTQTHGFAAPEFAELWEKTSSTFDLYSLGATAYHLLLGASPERIAIEESTEYPTLRTDLLDHLPPDTANVIRKALNPAATRFSDARSMQLAARKARLALSKTRPLDVSDLSLEYSEAGVVLRWKLPDDPRISGLRITQTEQPPAVIFEGAARSDFVDEGIVRGERTYRIETRAARDGGVLHSRGKLVRAEPFPPALEFSAHSQFGGNRLVIRLPRHASGALVRVSRDAAPQEYGDGAGLETSGGTLLHETQEAGDWHYAIFARYLDADGGTQISAPRFASAASFPALEPTGEISISQELGVVGVNWEFPVTGTFLRVRDSNGMRDVDAPGTSIRISEVLPDTPMHLSLLVRRQGVVSEPLHEVQFHSWPSPPTWQLSFGFGRVKLSTDRCNPSLEKHLVFIGTKLIAELRTEQVLNGHVLDTLSGAAELKIVSCLGNSNLGPEFVAREYFPSSADQPLAQIFSETGRIVAQLNLARSFENYRGTVNISLHRADAELVLLSGTPQQLFVVSGERLLWSFADTTAPPGVPISYSLKLSLPLGDLFVGATSEVVFIEKLPPPKVVPLLGAIEICSDPEIIRADVELVADDFEEVRQAVSLPKSIAIQPGKWVQVRWRRAVFGCEMAWSDAVKLRALRRPDVPSEGVAAIEDGIVNLRWAPVLEDDVSYEVRDDGGSLIYRGTECLCRDPQSASTTYQIVAVARGLASEVLVVAGALTTARGRTELVAMDFSKPQNVVLAESPTELVSLLVIDGAFCVTLQKAPGFRRYVVIGGKSDEHLEASTQQFLQTCNAKLNEVVADVDLVSIRPRIAWTRRFAKFCILEFSGSEKLPKLVVRNVEAVPAVVAVISQWLDFQANEVAKLQIQPARNHTPEPRLRVRLKDGSISNLAPEPIARRRDNSPHYAGLEHVVAVEGVEDDSGRRYLILPASGAASEPKGELFLDSLVSSVRRAVQSFVRAQRFRVYDESFGTSTSLNLIFGSDHTRLSLVVWDVTGSGRAQLEVDMSSVLGRVQLSLKIQQDDRSLAETLDRRLTAEWKRIVDRAEGVRARMSSRTSP